jgi:hypothetical protein
VWTVWWKSQSYYGAVFRALQNEALGGSVGCWVRCIRSRPSVSVWNSGFEWFDMKISGLQPVRSYATMRFGEHLPVRQRFGVFSASGTIILRWMNGCFHGKQPCADSCAYELTSFTVLCASPLLLAWEREGNTFQKARWIAEPLVHHNVSWAVEENESLSLKTQFGPFDSEARLIKTKIVDDWSS